MDAEARFETSNEGEEIVNGTDDGVHIHVDVVAIHQLVSETRPYYITTLPSDSPCQLFRSPASLRAGVFRAHITSMENPAGEFSGIGRDVTRIRRFSGNASGVCNDLFV